MKLRCPLILAFLLFSIISFKLHAQSAAKPNVVLIYLDDLGYGDPSCYGATKLHTPNIDKLAKNGILFTDGHCTSATCTPSRYGMLTGKYPWRKKGTGVLPGDAALIIPTNEITLPKVFKQAGYKTGIVGKWHLGLGNTIEKDWNADIAPGPNEVGFDYSYIFPATADRVPTVFLENHKIIGHRKDDPIKVNYSKKIGTEPTGKENPELLKQKASHGHDATIVNGIGRIGFMEGGKTARWTDEELGYTFLMKAQQFIANNTKSPFFLYYSLTEPHAPRMPATAFKEASGLGFRGDAILQIDWAVGEIMKELKYQGLDKNTIIILSSDNGPVLDDGYEDEAVERLNGHTPAGPLRGGKYSIYEAGTRVPFIVSWPGKIKPSKSNATVSQLDFLSSFAAMLGIKIPEAASLDSKNTMSAFLGKSTQGTDILIEHAGTLAIVKDGWKYVEGKDGDALFKHVGIESGIDKAGYLFNLKNDIGEKNNLLGKHPEKAKELAALLKKIKEGKGK